jgi:predicted adenylyl cyclase CyaB
MRNLEAKFRLANLRQAQEAAETIGFVRRATLAQRDTFFNATNGKLKLREEPLSATLIHYQRDRAGDLELSNYAIVTVPDPGAMRAMLEASLGVIATVRKCRIVLIRSNVRLHLDDVEGLGQFGEIEAILREHEAAALYDEEVRGILEALGVPASALIATSYFELMRAAAGR